MAHKIDFSIATSNQIEKALCQQLENIRLAQNITQHQLALDAGLSVQTIKRMAQGKGITVDTFIRILIALGLQENLAALLPVFNVRPIERIKMKGSERKRARPILGTADPHPWAWHEDTGEDE
jgi:transcriptional regulator with XRE-family HTH domain